MSLDLLLVIMCALCIAAVLQWRAVRRLKGAMDVIHDSFWPRSVWSPQDDASWRRGTGIFAHDTLDADAALDALCRDNRPSRHAEMARQAGRQRIRRERRWRWLPWSAFRRRARAASRLSDYIAVDAVIDDDNFALTPTDHDVADLCWERGNWRTR